MEEREQHLQEIMDKVRDLCYSAWYNRATGNVEVYDDDFADSCHALIFVKDGKMWGELKDDHVIGDVGDMEKLEEYLKDPWGWEKE